ncbi:hypothetical protein CLOSTMETH_02070 [[Clostridium] methylpentosum DSM 5476]|uniref:Uncharacterized protein n=1 Tax=[Clostridium] methylpentosum DSM 5476 TaxID=537013 RepID=C0EDZ1_9FIRM|nr:hypothetical protein CLOSTMETH_02070 [[Clostridium] methylpentosum DSM 5476]
MVYSSRGVDTSSLRFSLPLIWASRFGCSGKFEKVDKSFPEKWHIPNSLGIRL